MTRALSSALVLVVACQAPDDPEVRPGPGPGVDAVPVIYGGSAPSRPEHDAVVALHQRVGSSVYVQPFCTGTLIASDVVLTAAHCLDTANGGPKFKTMSPGSLAIYVGDDPAEDLVAHVYAVTETRIHPSYDRRRLRNDLALVRLTRPVAEPVAPVPPLPAALGFTAADVGTWMDFAGFGVTESGSAGVKLHAELPLGSLGCRIAGCPSGSDSATQVAYAQWIGGPCFGDSGGPMFVDRGGVVHVGGVTSYGDGDCTVYGVSTRVDAFEAFIDDFVGVDDDPPPAPDTDAGGGGADTCGDDVCDADESCDGRDGTLACPSDCPGRKNGKKQNRYCYVGDTCEGPGCP